MTYLAEKHKIISGLKKLGCNLLRDNNDLDFGLVDKSKKEEVYKFLILEGFICKKKGISKMNFKKFIELKIIDVDIEIDTKYLKEFFYDVEIKKSFEREYFLNPEKNQIAMKTLRYILLLRSKNNYIEFLYQNKDTIIKNNFFLDKLTKNPFKKELNFETFIKIVSLNKVELLKNIKVKYILYFIYLKLISKICRKKGKIIAIDGVDGAGKTTIINILVKELKKPSIYMGDRRFKYEKFYRSKKHFLLKPFSLIGQYLEKIYRILKAKQLAKKYGIVFCDRYHQYSPTATSIKYIDYFERIFFKFYPKPDKVIVLWNTPDIILKRKKEVTKEYIENFNKNKENIYKNAIFIKNDNIDKTLNLILKEIYA